jgi:geranylgeranyl diphosphate synthase type II
MFYPLHARRKICMRATAYRRDYDAIHVRLNSLTTTDATLVIAPPALEVDPFASFIATSLAEIEAALDRALPAPPVCPAAVAEAMRYGVMGPGKRMRPLLTLAAAETVALGDCEIVDDAVVEARRLAMPAACAVEFIHCYSLIHDDLPAMDNDSLRRGRPTVHVVFGEALAILAGDGLLAEAFALLAHEPDDRRLPQLAERKLRVLRRVGAALGAGGMLGGQAMDLASFDHRTGQPRADRDLDATTLREIHARKTGSLMRAAAVSGAIMAGGTTAQVDAVDRFAAEMGLAFQIVDDILDVAGAPGVVGKTIGKDRAQHKATYPAMFGVERSRQLAAACVERAQQALLAAGLALDLLAPMAHWTIARCR